MRIQSDSAGPSLHAAKQPATAQPSVTDGTCSDGALCLYLVQPLLSGSKDSTVRQVTVMRKPKSVVGSKAVPSSLKSLQPAASQRSLFVTRLPPDATAEDLSEFVSQTFRLQATCIKIVSGQFRSSFKVTVQTTQPKLLYDSAHWPEGVLIRHYYEHHVSTT